MEVEFADPKLDRLETDPTYTAGWAAAIVTAFRKRLWTIRAASDERDFYGLAGSLHYERLKGKRAHQRSMKLNDQYRLIVELTGTGSSTKVRVVGIEDYH